MHNFFDWCYYLETYPDLELNGIQTAEAALHHWRSYGEKEGRTAIRPPPLFDWRYYLEKYPDLRKHGIETEHAALHHWRSYGEKEGRVFIRTPLFFDWRYYLETYPDLRKHGIQSEHAALRHWFTNGIREKRLPFNSKKFNNFVGLLIPSTSHGREWQNSAETYLYTTLNSFLTSTADPLQKISCRYKFYIGIDRNDKILDTPAFRTDINNIIKPFAHIQIEYIYTDGIAKGHLTAMWNRLFAKALADGCDYFYQCGDDINFKTKGWVKDAIGTLKKNNNIGLTGPVNNNPHILTQSFVSRKHYDCFGYYFPEEIRNWFCDDWINAVYRGLNAYFPLKQHLCDNIGGIPRYCIDDQLRETYMELVNRDLLRQKPQ